MVDSDHLEGPSHVVIEGVPISDMALLLADWASEVTR